MSQPAYDVEQPDNFDEDDNATRQIDEMELARARVEQTRAEMSDTIEALKEKLEPSHLVEQAKDTVREATIGRAQHAMDDAMDKAKDAVGDAMGRARGAVDRVGTTTRDYTSTIVDVIRENPIPAAMIGIGLGWLLMSARKNGRRYDYDYDYETTYRGDYVYTGYPDRQMTDDYENPAWSGTGAAVGYTGTEDRSRVRDAASNLRDRAGETMGRVRGRASEMASNVRERTGEMASTVRERTGEVASTVKERTGEMIDRGRERAADLGERARYQSRQVMYGVRDTVDEDPLAAGVVALAVGAALGCLLPETRREREMMGEARDRLMDRAQDVARQVGDKVQNVAREAADTVKTAAQDQGLTGGAAGSGGAAMGGTGTETSTSGDATMSTAADLGLTGEQRAA